MLRKELHWRDKTVQINIGYTCKFLVNAVIISSTLCYQGLSDNNLLLTSIDKYVHVKVVIGNNVSAVFLWQFGSVFT